MESISSLLSNKKDQKAVGLLKQITFVMLLSKNIGINSKELLKKKGKASISSNNYQYSVQLLLKLQEKLLIVSKETAFVTIIYLKLGDMPWILSNRCGNQISGNKYNALPGGGGKRKCKK